MVRVVNNADPDFPGAHGCVSHTDIQMGTYMYKQAHNHWYVSVHTHPHIRFFHTHERRYKHEHVAKIVITVMSTHASAILMYGHATSSCRKLQNRSWAVWWVNLQGRGRWVRSLSRLTNAESWLCAFLCVKSCRGWSWYEPVLKAILWLDTAVTHYTATQQRRRANQFPRVQANPSPFPPRLVSCTMHRLGVCHRTCGFRKFWIHSSIYMGLGRLSSACVYAHCAHARMSAHTRYPAFKLQNAIHENVGGEWSLFTKFDAVMVGFNDARRFIWWCHQRENIRAVLWWS